MSLIVLDTDVASRLFRRRLTTSLTSEFAGHTLAITFVTLGEMTKWTLVRNWGLRERSKLDGFVRDLAVLPYGKKVARRWGELQAYAQLRGRPRPQNDTWIAACCLVRDIPLATLNRKDFVNFAEHEGLRLIDES